MTQLPIEPFASTCTPACDCHNTAPVAAPVSRREAIKLFGIGTAALLTPNIPVMAGPFDRTDFGNLVPTDKKFNADWLRSLTQRGTPTVYRADELRFIGMPIGGIGAGQLYLGGDGKLWHWDIFNNPLPRPTDAAHYANPLQPTSPIEQGFALQVLAEGQTQSRDLDGSGFRDISFAGQYPIATVNYRDDNASVEVTLEAFSPFIPLQTDDSSLPATILNFTVKNISDAPLEVGLSGWLQNAVCNGKQWPGALRRNQIVRDPNASYLNCSVEKSVANPNTLRPDIIFETWNRDTFAPWKAEGQSFGSRPLKRNEIQTYQGEIGGTGERVVNSHSGAPGNDVGARDNFTGKLTSPNFTIERDYLHFWIGGGADKNQLGLRLVVDGKIIHSAAGVDNNQMQLKSFDVRPLRGQNAHLEIVDEATGPWGHTGVGEIRFSDNPTAGTALESLHDFGTMTLTLLGAPPEIARAGDGKGGGNSTDLSAPLGDTLIGSLGRRFQLAPGQSQNVTFIIAWHFPNLNIQGLGEVGRFYASKFNSAHEVARYVNLNFARLATQTRLWRDTWYDSTLPFWLLDRTLLNASILATSTCFRLRDGRFYAWEGVGCCPGTCTHVWHYAQAVARLFPDLERDTRERVDLGIAFDQNSGVMGFRAEFDRSLAVDGQAGTLLRVYREHQMSPDAAFLKRNWSKIRRAYEPLLALDSDGDGILQGAQMNTLDTAWHGKISWLSSLYVAALHAGAQMAEEMNEDDFAKRCRTVAARGSKNLVDQLFNGEYFMNTIDPTKPETINSGTGCEIDQVLGQSWAWQVGLGRVLPQKETRVALQSLFKFNFSPDVGPYRAAYKPGRWYAMAGEAGLLMCSFPRRDWDYPQAAGKGPDWAAGYFNECMNGFEYQAASHMIAEGLVPEGLAVTRAVHDRYHAARRNPWNEVECGDHYARSMASYGVFIAASGFENHGPRAHLGFAPRISPENFRCAFTTAQSWGSFSQRIENGALTAQIAPRWGTLRLKTIALQVPPDVKNETARVTLGGKTVGAKLKVEDGRALLTLTDEISLNVGETLQIRVG